MSLPALFIYGSLLTGSGLPAVDRLLPKYSRCLGAAVMRGRLYLLDGYPGALPSFRCQDRVLGRVVRLRDAERVIRRLDDYEDFRRDRPKRGEFIRARTVVTLLSSGRRLPVWVYLYNGCVKDKRRIPEGDYPGFRRGAAPSR